MISLTQAHFMCLSQRCRSKRSSKLINIMELISKFEGKEKELLFSLNINDQKNQLIQTTGIICERQKSESE
jgi:hypothetical protein